MTKEETNRQVFEKFAAAWRAADFDGLAALIDESIVFGASAGPEPGATFHGRDAALRGFRAMIEYDRNATLTPTLTRYHGDIAIIEWVVTSNDPQSHPMKPVRGIDVFEFHDGLITRKDAFRKVMA